MLVTGCGCHAVPFSNSSLTAYVQLDLEGNLILMEILSG